MTFVPVALFWLLASWALISRRPVVLYLFFASMPFGAFAVVPTEFTAGLTFTATPIVCLILIARAFFSRGGPDFFLTSALRPHRLGLLFMFWLTAVVVTVFMPRIFAGDVLIVPIRGELSEASMLFPSAQNISQLVYMTISVFTVFAFARILQARDDRQHALKALCFGGAVAGLTGFIDYGTQFLPIEPLLEPFRTASYALMTNVEVLGAKRVVGLMPEASAFGGLCLAMLSALVFFRRAIAVARIRNLYAPIVIAMLALSCWLATSSGAYLGLGVLILVLLGEGVLRAFSGGRTRQLYRQDLLGELTLVMGLVAIVGVLVMLRPAAMEPVFAVIDRMVLQKTESNSFDERGMWRTVAMNAVYATNGLGVGLGGTRSSSSLVAIFAGTGVLGGLLYYLFVIQTLLRRSAHMDWEGQFILSAFRFSFIPTFAVSLLVGGANFGALTAFGFGIVTATVHSSANKARKLAARSGRSGTARRLYEPGQDRARPALPPPVATPQG